MTGTAASRATDITNDAKWGNGKNEMSDQKSGTNAQSNVQHKTLSAYYTRLYTLETYFQTTLATANTPRPLKDLLSSIVVAVNGENSHVVPKLGGIDMSQQAALDRISSDLEGRGKNILIMAERVGHAMLRLMRHAVADHSSPTSLLLRSHRVDARAQQRFTVCHGAYFVQSASWCTTQLLTPQVGTCPRRDDLHKVLMPESETQRSDTS